MSSESGTGPVLAARGLSKRFRLYQRPWHRLLEVLGGSRPRHSEFWALRDVTFDLDRGEVLGVLGPNGAGKSTLLRLLAGASRPTAGSLHRRGRMAALLELGAGFHPELTGRQNLMMTARLMGIPEAQARRRLPDMAAFAEIDTFLDQPVRTYSSGMVVRLGFAVAAGFDPEILVLDEALAVGDAYFQRKSLQRIERLRDAGCSILLVTHDLRLIGRFCNRALWLDGGRVRALGPAPEVMRAYEAEVRRHEEERLSRAARREPAAAAPPASAPPAEGARWGDGPIRILGVEMAVAGQPPGWVFRLRDRVELRLHALFLEPVERPVFSFQVHRSDGVYVTGTSTSDNNVDHHPLGPQEGACTLVFRFDPLHLHAGSYFLSAQAFTEPDEPFWSRPSDCHFHAWEFRVLSPYAPHGVVALPGRWQRRDGVPGRLLPREVRPGESEGAPWLTGRWHGAEDGDVPWRWTGPEAGAVLDRGPDDAVLLLDLRLPRASGRSQEVAVLVADRAAGRWPVPAGRATLLRIPVPGDVPVGPVRVTLRVGQTWSPRQEGGDDPRDLGVAVVSIAWERAALRRREAE